MAVVLTAPSFVHSGAFSLVETTDFMHARYYSPNLGRFMSVDKVGGAVGSSQSWNRYSYAKNSPTNRIDPDGNADTAWGYQYTAYAWRSQDAIAAGTKTEADYSAENLTFAAAGATATTAAAGMATGTYYVVPAALNPATAPIVIKTAELFAPPGSPGLASIRGAYIRQTETIHDAAVAMMENGATAEAAARAMVPVRNALKMQQRAAGSWLARKWANLRNLVKYGRREGPTADDLFEKYGSWEKVVDKLAETDPNLNRLVASD